MDTYRSKDMIRHSQNSNLSLHHHSAYQGFSVQTERGPLITDYLDRLWQVTQSALQQYPRVFAFRIDLRFPADQSFHHFDNNLVVEKFIASLKAKLRHNRSKAMALNPYAHDTEVRYVWCREVGHHGIPHYHMAILLNNDAFCSLGHYEPGRDNMFNRLHEAWASALGLPVESAMGLVEFPQNPFYLLQDSDPGALADFFYRSSYLCKAETKQYGNRVHGFGASRC